MTHREIGTFNNIYPSSIGVEDYIGDALGPFAKDYDVPALVDAYRKAINTALPDDVVLSGDMFIAEIGIVSQKSPFGDQTMSSKLDIKNIIDEIDIWEFADKYEISRD